MKEKEEERAEKAKKEMKAYKAERKKWAKRLANLKIMCGIIVLGLCKSALDTQADPVHRTAAVFCLAGLIYYVLITELNAMMPSKEKEEEKERPTKRKKVPNVSDVSSFGDCKTDVVDTRNGHDIPLRALRRGCQGIRLHTGPRS